MRSVQASCRRKRKREKFRLPKLVGDDVCDRLLQFIGYGNLSAPIWFLGLEEGAGGSSEAEFIANLRTRARFCPVMDLAEAHLELEFGGHSLRIDTAKSFPTQVWLWMARIEYALNSETTAVEILDAECAKSKVRSSLGSKLGQSLLIEFSPLPAQDRSTWPYELWFASGFKEYEETVLEERKIKIRQLISLFSPQWLIAYGTSNYQKYRDIFPETKWAADDYGNDRCRV